MGEELRGVRLAASPFTCILVDDDFWAMLDIKKIFPFEEMGFSVVGEYGSAKDAMEAIEKKPPSLVITDICLGGMNGLQLIETCRRNGYAGQFIVISGFSEFEYARQALEHGVVTYLLKPIDSTEGREALRKTIARLTNDEAVYGEQDIVDRIRAYIQSHYRQKLSLEEIAETFSMNKTYFSEFFSRHFGKSFVQYKNDVRVERAKVLLQSMGKPITEIAGESGFDNASYFTLVFRQATGMSPDQYRKKKGGQG